MGIVTDLSQHISLKQACEALNVPRSRVYRARQPQPATKPRPTPPNALTPDERATLRETLNSERFMDATPRQVYANLLESTGDVRFTHQLLQEYFAARRLDEAMQSGTPASDFWQWDNLFNEWNETAILLAGLYNTDCTPVVNWLKHTNPELAGRCVAESGASIADETLQQLQADWLPKLTDEASIPEPKQRAAFGRGAGLVQIDDLPLDNRKGVSIVVVGDRRLPDITWGR